MPVPSNRLLIHAAVIGIPLFTLLGVAEAPVPVLLGIAVFLLLLVGLDAPAATSRLQKVRVSMPPVIRTSKGRDFDVPLVIADKASKLKQIRVGIALPDELRAEKQILEFKLTAEKEAYQVAWHVTALERGQFNITAVHVESSSYMGWWLGRRAIPLNTEIRVYPDLSHEKNVLAPLFFRRGSIGVHQVRQIGKGREFEQLRAYVPGDSYEDIYWKGTAKRRFPVTRMFQLERTQEVYVVIDCSRRSRRKLEGFMGDVEAGMVAKTQMERYIQAALLVALAAQHQGDRFGLVVFSDQVQRIIPAGGGRKHYEAIRDTLYTLHASAASPDFEELFVQLGNHIRHRALLIFLTDLAEPWLSESFVEHVALISRRHVVLVHMLGQKEVRPMFGKDDDLDDDNDLYGRLAGQLMWNDFLETTRLLKQRRVHITSSSQESLVADVVNEYLRVKKRQLI